MIEPIKGKVRESKIVKMCDMSPFDIGIIIDKEQVHCGKVVMRTASLGNVEIIDLSNPRADGCWESTISSMPVELFKSGESITLKVE